MRKTSLIATTLTLALAGAPAVAVATASPVPDPIAHAAGQHVNPIAHAAGPASSDPYIDPVGHHHGHNPYVDPLGATTGSGAPQPGHAYGKQCADESRVHVDGHPGTPFSECVHALKTLAGGTAHSPAAACKAEPRKHTKGQKGTPYSRCVAAARALLHGKRSHATKHSTATHGTASRRQVTGPR